MSTSYPGCPTLDGRLVRSRRLELNLSERTLAARLGPAFSQTIVRNIEAGRAGKDLTLGDVARIAETLDLPLENLLLAPTSSTAGTSSLGPLTLTEDQARLDEAAKQVGALLRALGCPVPAASLAASVGVNLYELQNLVENLRASLEPAGMTVREFGGMISLASDITADASALRRLAREHLARDSMTISQALTLSKAAAGRLTKKVRSSSTAGNPGQVAIGSLLNAGILVRTDSGGVTVSDDVKFSLLLGSH